VNPALKYTLARFGLFFAFLLLLTPVPLNILIKAMIAVVLSAIASFFLLAKWRDQVAERLGTVADKRKAEKDRLRAALAGDEAAAAEGDRVAEPKAVDK
jgi:hypothetical protein